MKNLLLLIALFFVYVTVFGQVENRQIITPEMELKFKTEIEAESWEDEAWCTIANL